MKRVNSRTLPTVSEAFSFCRLFYTNPDISSPFEAPPEILGIDLVSEQGDRENNLVAPDRFYHKNEAAYVGSGIPFSKTGFKLSQKECAEKLGLHSPLAVRTDFETLLVLSIWLKFGVRDKIVLPAKTLAAVAGETPPKFENAVQMRRFFREIALTYF